MTTKLPAEFADLEPFADWAIEGENARYDKRLASSMDELQGFYDAAFPRLQAGKDYLDALELDDLPEDATHLLWLLMGLVVASFPVEVWRQAKVPDSGAAMVLTTLEPAV